MCGRRTGRRGGTGRQCHGRAWAAATRAIGAVCFVCVADAGRVAELRKQYDKTEDDLKALQSVGQVGAACGRAVVCVRSRPAQQMIGEVLRQLDDERFIVKTSSGPRYVVGCRRKVDRCVTRPRLRN